jgi:hypothetical protein
MRLPLQALQLRKEVRTATQVETLSKLVAVTQTTITTRITKQLRARSSKDLKCLLSFFRSGIND